MLALFPSFSLVANCLYAKSPDRCLIGGTLTKVMSSILFSGILAVVAGQENVWRRLKPHHAIAGNYLSNKQIFLKPYLKVPKREIFDRSDFPDFYTIKSLREGDCGVKIKR